MGTCGATQRREQYVAVAAQVDGYSEVVVKDQYGRKILTKIPNGQTVKVLHVDGVQAEVRWNEIEGFVKKVNIKPVELLHEGRGGGRGQVPYDAFAQQVDGHPDVVVKDQDGKNMAKIPNGQLVVVVQIGGDQVKLRWNDVEGFAKAVNIKPVVAEVRPDPTPLVGQAQQTAITKQAENFPDVVIKKDGRVVTKIPNGETVIIVRQDGGESFVQWGVHEGWAKSANLQNIAAPGPVNEPDLLLGPQLDHGPSVEISGPTVTPQPLTHALISGQSCGNIYVCGQITEEMNKRLNDLRPQSMKASMPKFNLPASGGHVPNGMEQYDIPCFGPALTEVVTALLNVDVVKKMADELRFMLPRCSINEVIQRKNAERGPQLLDEIRRAGGDEAAVKKLESFVTKVGKLAAPDFVCADGKPRTDGRSWIDEFCPTGWKAKLHVDEVLTNFGFSIDFCNEFKTRPLRAGSKDTWTEFAVRWLSKAFDIFSYQGSMSDVVNLIFAMLGKPPSKPDIAEVVQTVKDFTEILRTKQWQKIVWKPSCVIHDSELDDMLAWLLCSTIGSETGSTISCSVQLPPSERTLGQLDHLQAQYESRSTSQHGITVFRDPSSRNRDIVIYSACFVPPKFVYLVSETEMRPFVGRYDWHQESNMFWSGRRRLYINPATGYWCVSLDVNGMQTGYYQMRALKKGCIPHINLGWRMLVQTENNPANTVSGLGTSQNEWEELNTNGRQATWQDLNSEGEPILPGGSVKALPDDRKPIFQFWISGDPREHPESPPLCFHKCERGQPCRQEAKFDGWTRCEAHRQENPKQNKQCPAYIQARRFLEELSVDEFVDHNWDHCWCPSCHPASMPDTIPDPANRQQMQIVPRGWVAFGVVSGHLREAGFEDIWKWPMTFHGTQGDLVPSILRHGHIGMPGDRLIDGTAVKSRGHGDLQASKFYTSPTAAYAGLQLFARPRKSTSMPGIVGQVVLQCKQNREPGSVLLEQGETLKFKANGFPDHGVCKHIPLYSSGTQAIEIVSERPDLCVIRQLLIRIFPENNPPSKSKPGDLKPIPNNYEQFRSPVDCRPGPSHGDGCVWL